MTATTRATATPAATNAARGTEDLRRARGDGGTCGAAVGGGACGKGSSADTAHLLLTGQSSHPPRALSFADGPGRTRLAT